MKDIRLSGKSTTNEGELEIFYKDQWRTISDENWMKPNADVACRALGYSRADKILPAPNDVTTLYKETWKIEVNCTGIEVALQFCEHEHNLLSRSNSKDDRAAVRCISNGKKRKDLRKLSLPQCSAKSKSNFIFYRIK